MANLPYKIEIDKTKYIIGEKIEEADKRISIYLKKFEADAAAAEEILKRVKEDLKTIEKAALDIIRNVNQMKSSQQQVRHYERFYTAVYYEFQKVIQIHDPSIKQKQLKNATVAHAVVDKQVKQISDTAMDCVGKHEKYTTALQGVLDKLTAKMKI